MDIRDIPKKLREDFHKNKKPISGLMNDVFSAITPLKEGYAIIYGVGSNVNIITADCMLSDEDIKKEENLQNILDEYMEICIDKGIFNLNVLLSSAYATMEIVAEKIKDEKEPIPDDVKESLNNIIDFLSKKKK